MKGIKLLLAVLLAPLAFQAAADDASDIARAATRRSASTPITTNRQKPTTTPTKKATTASRATNIGKSGATVRERTQTTTTTPRTATDHESMAIHHTVRRSFFKSFADEFFKFHNCLRFRLTNLSNIYYMGF